jgi:hypothetical protein
MLFRPWERHMIEKNAKNELAAAKDRSGRPEVKALQRAQEGVEAYSGPQHKISGSDEVQYTDTRDDLAQALSDLVVE